MRRAVAALVGAALVVCGLGVAAPTSATTAVDGPLTIAVFDNQALAGDCADYPIAYSVDVEPDRRWWLTVTTTNTSLDGWGDVDHDEGVGDVTGARLFAQLCDTLDGPGRYEYAAVLELAPLLDGDEILPGATHYATAEGSLVVRTAVSLSTTHKKFAKKYATKRNPHTYKVSGSVSNVGGCFGDGAQRTIEVQYRRSGAASFTTLRTLSLNDDYCSYRTSVKLTKKGTLRVRYLGAVPTLGSASRSVAVN